MKLTITLEDVEYDELLSATEHINNGYFEPHYRTCRGDIDYEYKVEPTADDYVNFFLEKANTAIVKSKEEIKPLVRMFNDGFFKNWFESALDVLQWEDDFEAFMKERYYDKALEKYYEDR